MEIEDLEAYAYTEVVRIDRQMISILNELAQLKARVRNLECPPIGPGDVFIPNCKYTDTVELKGAVDLTCNHP